TASRRRTRWSAAAVHPGGRHQMPRSGSRKPEEMTVAEAGRKGGEQVKAKYGKDFYSEIGHRGGAATRAKYGPDFYGESGRKGGQGRDEKHGAEFYEKIGKKGGQRVKELIEQGKKAAEEPG